ncbi:MAG: DUF4124 domain-containing protein [Deltaproteobacteria bacterium]|nr:DUF4124 domain-containing protein [Deltaproteobacteria bacterium]
MLRHALRLLLALALCLAAQSSRADVYRWVDELGVTHYTTDPETIPRRHRDSAHAIVARPSRRPGPRISNAPSRAATPLPSAPEPASPEPAARATPPAPSGPPVFPGPPLAPALAPGDPRAAELADLEARIATDRETLRQLISTKRWDSAELASDPGVREIAERLPRLQAELEALRAETVP